MPLATISPMPSQAGSGKASSHSSTPNRLAKITVL